MPLLLLLLFLTDLITIVLIGGDIYLFREWYLWKDTIEFLYARDCLYGAIAITAYSFFGKMPVTWLVSKIRKAEDEPKPEHSEQTEKLKRPDGTIIHIEFLGDSKAKPLLFVHGWNENTTIWYYQKKYFSKKYRVILIDLPGLGKTKGPDNNDYSLQKMAADLEAVIEHLSLNQVVLWGHSIGGMVILTYCTQIGKNISQRVKGIVLQHTTYTDPTDTSILSGLLKAIEKPVLYPLCYLMIALWPILWISKWMSYFNGNMLLSTRFSTFTGTQTHQQLDFVSRLSAMAPPNVFARGMLGMMKTYDVSDDLTKLKVPVLILAARSDRLTKLVASEYMRNNIPNAQMIVLSPAGHQGLIERHAESIEAADGFMEGLSKHKDQMIAKKPVNLS
jgi:pimeloyl-ACP methyl ester carboxylesterase